MREVRRRKEERRGERNYFLPITERVALHTCEGNFLVYLRYSDPHMMVSGGSVSLEFTTQPAPTTHLSLT